MSKPARVFVALLLGTACGYAFAQSASFGLTLRILPDGAATEVPADLPMPPQARLLPPSHNARRLLYSGSAGDARRFYEDVLPGLGFSLTRQKADSATWEHPGVRAELLFYPVVGTRETTGIIVTMVRREPVGATDR